MIALILAAVIAWPGWHPFPRPTTGVATWYADGPGLYAAIPGFRGHPFYVIVTRGIYKVRVLVRDGCACHVRTKDARMIDLSPAAFVRLGLPLSRGVMKVTVQR